MSIKKYLSGCLALIVLLCSVPINNQVDASASGLLDGKGISVTEAVYKNSTDPRPNHLLNASTPAAPKNLIVTGQSGRDVYLAWEEVNPAEVSYHYVYVNGVVMSGLFIDSGKTVLRNLQPGEYKISVTAVYKNGMKSSPSNEVSVIVTGEPTTSLSPQNLVMTATAEMDADFTWDPVGSADLDYYQLYINGNKYDSIRNRTSISLSGFPMGTHTIYVTAVYKNGDESASSNVVVVDLTPSPKNLVVTSQTGESFDFTWEGVNSPELDRYQVYINGARINSVKDPKFTLDGFRAGQHKLYVTAIYKNGVESKPSNEVTIDIKGAVTPAPQNLVVSGRTETVVDLEWTADPSPELDYYAVYVNGIEVNRVQDKSRISITVTPRLHYVHVTTVYKNGVESAPSAIKVNVDPAPQNLVVTDTNWSKVDIKWEEVNSPEFAYYSIYVNDKKMMDQHLNVGKAALSRLAPGPTNIYVTATYKNGDVSRLSNEVKVNVVAEQAYPPYNLVVSGQTENTIDLTWQGVQTSELDYYQVYVDGKKYSHSFSPNMTLYKSSFSPGEHVIHVTAVHKNTVESGPSNEVTVDLTLSPQNLVVTSQTGESFDFTWEGVNSPELDHYRLYFNGARINTVKDPNFTSDGFPAGQHKLYVTAVYKNGVESKPSNEVTIDVKGAVTPTPSPKNLVASGQTESTVDLTWQSVQSSELDYYQVYVNHQRTVEVRDKSTIHLTGVQAGHNEVYVTAVYKDGTESSPSNVVSVDFVLAPKNLKVTNQTLTSVDIAWDAVNAPEVIYNVFLNGVLHVPVFDGTTYTVTNLTPGETYSIYVKAHYQNIGDMSEASNEVIVDMTSKVSTTPTPKNLVVSGQTERVIDFAWEADHSTELDYYAVYMDGTVINKVHDKSQFSLTVAPGPHSVFVTAVYKNGVESAPSNIVTVDVTPMPKNLVVTGQTETSVSLSWDPIDIAELDYYNVYVNGRHIASRRGTTKTTISGLPSGEARSIYITAVYYGNRTSVESKPSNVVTVKEASISTPIPENHVVIAQPKTKEELAKEEAHSITVKSKEALKNWLVLPKINISPIVNIPPIVK